MKKIFYSADPQYRNPTGAVKENTNIHIKIHLSRHLGCSAAKLLLQDDNTQKISEFGMFWCGMYTDTEEMWECDYKAEKSGLFFYRFEIQTKDGPKNLSRGLFGNADILPGPCLFPENPAWQLTVYSSNFSPPQWLAGGIMYQIFPDRFFASKENKSSVPADRTIHQYWQDSPNWQPDETGEVKNSDYFGGDLKGIQQKLDYLQDLGVTCIYLNPIFEAHSNHRYDTADYTKIDPLLGTIPDFQTLCKESAKRGIKIILDGVFSHTGSDSIYFNKQNRYLSNGAFNTQASPYFKWYTFKQWPNDYSCWWGFKNLPETKETETSYQNYINGPNGIVQKWINEGAAGWRLDVADELPDEFLENLRKAAKTANPHATIIGEVWEDASRKQSYSRRRKYLLGNQLDSVMNYPFRDAIIGFFTKQLSAAQILEKILNILENYPQGVINILMNIIGTHDTERALTALGAEPVAGRSKAWQAEKKMTPEQKIRAVSLLKLASAMQYTLPGVPCLYYGDEAGLEGYRDPFCRQTYPWGQQDLQLLSWYQTLGKIRKQIPALKDGTFTPCFFSDHALSYLRTTKTSQLFCAFNIEEKTQRFPLPEGFNKNSKQIFTSTFDQNFLLLAPNQCSLLERLQN